MFIDCGVVHKSTRWFWIELTLSDSWVNLFLLYLEKVECINLQCRVVSLLQCVACVVIQY